MAFTGSISVEMTRIQEEREHKKERNSALGTADSDVKETIPVKEIPIF